MTHIAKQRDLSEPVEPISIDECREHLRIQSDEDSDGTHPEDTLILGLLSAAREHAEDFTGLTIARRQIEVALDEFPDDGEPIDLNVYPVIDLVSLSYILDGVEVDPNSSDITTELDEFSKPARVLLIDGSPWPTPDDRPNAVRIVVEAGYQSGEESSDDPALKLPPAIRSAILLTLGHLYENREASTEKAMSELPFGVDALLRPHRIRLGMA